MSIHINGKTITGFFINNKSVYMGTINNTIVYKMDKTELFNALQAAEAIGTTNLRWTTDTWEDFINAKAVAQEIYDKSSAAQSQVNNAAAELNNAITNLALQAIDVTFTGTMSKNITSDREGYAVLKSSGTLTLNANSNHFEVWALGGGGGGAGSNDYTGWGGGGGGGGYVNQLLDQVLSAGDYTVTIGAAGTGSSPAKDDGTNGGQSRFYRSGIIDLTANGGSKAPYVGQGWQTAGGDGGSGGGGGSGYHTTNGTRYICGIGGENGGDGATAQATQSANNPGGKGAGENQTIFKENFINTKYYGSGGSGGPFFDQTNNTNQTNNVRTDAGNFIRNANANCGGGGGGVNRGNGTNGGTGMVIVRWYD